MNYRGDDMIDELSDQEKSLMLARMLKDSMMPEHRGNMMSMEDMERWHKTETIQPRLI